MQQQQAALFGPHPEPTEMRSRPRSEEFTEGRTPPVADPRLDRQGLFDATKAGGQLPMFLSAREVTKNYRVLDGDRTTGLTHTTTPAHLPAWKLYNDRAVLHRKAEEAHRQPAEDAPHGAGLERTLSQDQFRVENPIPLQVEAHGYTHADVPEDRRGEPGDTRPPMSGGHHRVAVMMRFAPDRPMPVTHVDMNGGPAELMDEEPDIQGVVDDYSRKRVDLRRQYGEMSMTQAAVPGPWLASQVKKTKYGLFPASHSDEQIEQHEQAQVDAFDDLQDQVREIRKRRRRGIWHNLLGGS
jgi:hypothetical protein